MIEKISYSGWQNCLKLSNGKIEIIVTTDVGPRIIKLSFVNSLNLFGELKRGDEKIDKNKWEIYGGHRLWHAPEDPVRTYIPDNEPVNYEYKNNWLYLRPNLERETGIKKEIDIFLEPESNKVKVVHRLINKGLWAVTLSVWCLSVMAKKGFAIVPQEDKKPHGEENFLPVRSMALWSYTDTSDPRYYFGKDFVFLKQDPDLSSPQKIGFLNTKGWAAYYLNGYVFVKKFQCEKDKVYPDFNTNTQLFTNSEILEVETLSPLTLLLPGKSIEHIEEWFLFKVKLSFDETSVKENLLPLIKNL